MDNIEFKVIESFDEFMGKKIDVIQILINGNDLLDMFRNYACGGGYLKARELHMWLTEKYSSEYSSYLSCCSACREPGCSSVSAMITEVDDYVVWDRFCIEHQDVEFDYKFVFDREDYLKKVDGLYPEKEKADE